MSRDYEDYRCLKLSLPGCLIVYGIYICSQEKAFPKTLYMRCPPDFVTAKFRPNKAVFMSWHQTNLGLGACVTSVLVPQGITAGICYNKSACMLISAPAQSPLHSSSLHPHQKVLVCIHLPWSGLWSQVFEGQVSLLHGWPLVWLIAQALLNEQLHFLRGLLGMGFVVDTPQRLLGYQACANLPENSPETAVRQ